MIKNKEEYRYYLECDKVALQCGNKKVCIPLFNAEWGFERLLRKVEYYSNCRKDIIGRIYCRILRFKFMTKSQQLGYTISINTCGPGLSLAHIGTIAINRNARIGKNCRIHEGVTIGSTNGSNDAAHIGDNVFISTGAKIIGNITIADGVAIGANAVVVKDIKQENSTWGGSPSTFN